MLDMQRCFKTMRTLIAAIIGLLVFLYILLLFIVLGSGERWDDEPGRDVSAEAPAVSIEELRAEEEARRTSVPVTKSARQTVPLQSWPPQAASETAAAEESYTDSSGSMNFPPSK